MQHIEHKKVEIGFFLILLTLGLIVTYFIFAPVLEAFFLALVFAVVFYPMYKKLLMLFRGHKNLASFISVLIIIIVILVPVTFFTILLFQQSVSIYNHQLLSSADYGSVLSRAVVSVETYINHFIPRANIRLNQYIDFQAMVNQVVRFIATNSGLIFSGTVKFLFSVFILVFSLFYLFRDGKDFVAQTIALSPLHNNYDKQIIGHVKRAVGAVIKGHLIIAIIQGFLIGIGFAVFGIPGAVIFGFIGVVAALIPNIGTALISAPAIIYLYIASGVWPAVGFAVWAILIVGLVDNVCRPLLIQRDVKIHPLIIFLSVIGGLALFGPIGFIAGPVIVALLLTLLQIYPTILMGREFKED